MNKKIKKFLVIVYIITIVAILTGASFAYFTSVNVSTISPTTNTTTATTGWLYFDITKDIFINANENNFGMGMDNLSQEVYTSAQLRTEGDTKETYYYNIFVEIDYNDFEYTTVDQSSELVLQVYDPEDKLVTNIDGLTYDNENQGFDITIANGKYYIASNYPISANDVGNVIHTWKTKITLINMDSSQDLNRGKTISGKITIEKASDGDEV